MRWCDKPPIYVREYEADRALYEADPEFAASLGIPCLPPAFPRFVWEHNGQPVWEPTMYERLRAKAAASSGRRA